MKVTLFTLIVALSAFSISLSASADPECVYRQIRELPMHWANPLDCGRYYRCTNKNIKKEVVCDKKKEYNPKTGKCASAGKGYCKLSLLAPLVGIENVCADEVSGASVPQTDSCRNYYICENNNAYQQTCDAGSLFNTTLAACVPDTETECWENYCLNQTDGTYIADRTSCLNFYICNAKKAVQQNCNVGSYFNTTALNCQPDANNANCWENFCINANNGTWIANPSDCHAFYVCNNGLATPQQCAEGSYFDKTTSRCEPGECSNEPCEPTPPPCEPTPPPCTNGDCTCPGGYAEGTFLADPTSCMHYYICNGGVLVRNECSIGFYYNQTNGVCEYDSTNACPQCKANYRRARRSMDAVEIVNGEHDTEDVLDIVHEAVEKPEELIDPVPNAPQTETELKQLKPLDVLPEAFEKPEELIDLVPAVPELEPEPEQQLKPLLQTAVVPYVEPAADASADCSCPGGYASGTIVEHPTDCDKYYICVNGQLVLHECGQNYKYDSCLHVCVPDVDHTCWPVDNGCGCPSTPPTNYCNGKPNGMLLPNPQDCAGYFTCNSNEATPGQCTYDSWFDPVLKACVLDLNATCINPCAGTTGIKFLPHPDCSKFFFCNNGQTHVDTCPANTGFNEQYGACTADAPCPSNKCFNLADGTTFPDPDDNTKFYVCIDKVAIQGTCEANTQFNANIGVCMEQPSSNCDQTKCAASSSVPPYSTINNSPNSFCYCRGDGAHEINCQKDYLFNPAIGVCYSNAPCDPEICLEQEEYTVSVNRNNSDGFCLCVAQQQVEVNCPCGLTFHPRPLLCLPPITQDPNCNPTFCLNQPDYTTTSATTTNAGFCVCKYGSSTYQPCPNNGIYNPNPGVCVPNTPEAQCDSTQCSKLQPGLPFPTFNDPYAFCYCQNGTSVLQSCLPGSKFNAQQGVCLREFCNSALCTASTPPNEAFPAIDYPYGFCLCNGNEANLHECSNGTIFDANVSVCVPEVNLECDIKMCQQPNTPYPYDVPAVDDKYSFCYCINGDTVHLIRCPAGKIYDQKYGACVNETNIPPPCGSQCTCPGGYAPGSWLPHPTNCNQYYICQNGVLQLQTCGTNMYYSPSCAACMPDTSGQCNNGQQPSTCTCVGAFKENELIANAHNRNSYYRCLNAQLHEENCAPGFYFDALQSACYSEQNGRHFYKARTAVAASTTINEDFNCVDNEKRSVPSNCSQYEICINSMWQRRLCSKQRYYNPERKQCLEPRDDTVCNSARVLGLPNCNPETEEQTLPHKDSRQCGHYYRCKQGKWQLYACGEHKFYARKLRTCLDTNLTSICDARNASDAMDKAKCRHTAVRAYHDACDMYLMCLEGEWWYQYCPLGMYFNATQNYCMPNAERQCKAERALIVAPKQQQQQQQQPMEFTNDTCLDEGTLRASALGCDKYYICLQGKWRQQSCAKSGYYYNVTAEACLADTKGFCAALTQDTVCQHGTRREYPLNCTAYEACEHGVWQRKDCVGNSFFDVLLQQCVSNEPGYCALNGLRRTCRSGEKRAWPIKNECKRFFYCVADNWQAATCLQAHTYVAELQTCVPHAANDSCQPIWSKKLTDLQPAEVAAAAKEEEFNEANVCLQQADGASVPHPDDCTRFFLCLREHSVGMQQCVAGSFFDPKLGYCRPNDGSCIPTLPGICKKAKDGDLIADPEDCRNYYECTAEHGSQLLHCDEGYYFHKSSKQCRIDHGECQPHVPSLLCANETAHGSKVPHERYCNIYYACVRGLAIPVECPDGFEFNPVLSRCQLDEEKQCLNGVLTHGNETTYSCGNLTDGVYIPNRGDCTRYYICSKGHAQPKRCAEQAYFDAQQLLCVPDDGACPFVEDDDDDDSGSDNKPQPPDPSVCEGKHGKMLPDAANCNEFYVCINGKLRHERCYENYYFDAVSKQCLSNELPTTTTTSATTTTGTTFSSTTEAVATTMHIEVAAAELLELTKHTQQQRCTDKPTNFTALCTQIPSGGSIAEQGDCRRYISCQDTEPISQRCRIGESYDSLLGLCRQNDGTCSLENGQRVGECNGRHGSLVRDSENCRGYFVCINGQKIGGECVESEYFDKISNQCQVDVTNQCSLAPKKANDVVSCKSLSESVLYPYLHDHCRSYFQCVKGVPKILECADGLYFNATTKQCVKEINECVMPSAAVVQTSLLRAPEAAPEAAVASERQNLCKDVIYGQPYANVADHCRSYYVCDGQDSIVYTACPNGSLFSSEKSACAAASHVICNK